MTKIEINKTIHEWLGNCWGEEFSDVRGESSKCLKCGESAYKHTRPNYISESSPRSLLNDVEKRAIATFGGDAWFKALCLIVCPTDIYMDYVPWEVAQSGASERAAAVCKLVKEAA